MSPVSETVLRREPWADFCALLVIPGGADLGYCRALDGDFAGSNGNGGAGIARYVREGGAYLGLCAGGYYGSGRCEFEVGHPLLEVVGKRELAFFPGVCRGGAFGGFEYNSEAGARAAVLTVGEEALSIDGEAPALPDEFRCYVNGGGVFVDADRMSDQGVEVLATYGEPLAVHGGERGSAAVVCCRVGKGLAILTGPHIE